MDISQSPFVLMIAMMISFGLLGFIAYQIGMIRSKNATTLCLINLTAMMIVWVFYLTFGHKSVSSPQTTVNDFMVQLYGLLQLSMGNVPSTKAVILLQSFSIITGLMIIAGATAERLKLWPFMLFSMVFAGLIYPIQAHWLWGGGFLYQMGFIDQSGAGLIFLTGGLAGIMGSHRLGARVGKYSSTNFMPLRASQMPLVAIGGGMTALGLTLQSAMGFIHTQPNLAFSIVFDALEASLLTGAMSFLTALLINRFITGLSDLTIAVNGLFAGIAASAADPFHLDSNDPILFGLVTGIVCLVSIRMFERLKIDDPCGVGASFFSGGLLGLLAVITLQDYSALSQQYHVQWHWYQQLYTQLAGIGILIISVLVTSFLLWYLLDALFGLRLKPAEEDLGLDAHDCGTQAYPEFTHSGK